MCTCIYYQILMQDEKAFQKTVPGSLQGLNHFFIPKSARNQVFLPSTMLCKVTSSDTSDGGSSVDPETTINTQLAIEVSRKDVTQKQFMSDQEKAWNDIQSEKRRREAEERQRRQQKAKEELKLDDSAKFDTTLLDAKEQEKLLEEAKLQSKKQNINQTGGNHHPGYGNGSQTGPSNTQLDANTHGSNFGQQPQHYDPTPGGHQHHLVGTATGSSHHAHQSSNPNWYPLANQGNAMENYNMPITQQTFQEHQPPAQPPASQYYPQLYASQGYQPPPSQLQSPAQQMAHIPRAGVGDNTITYTVSTSGTRHDNYNRSNSHPHHRVKVHGYDEIPGQPDHYSQHNQYSGPPDHPVDYNPHNFEVGSMVQYGNPPRPGMIKWIGHLPGATSLVAGVEMVSPYICYTNIQKVTESTNVANMYI